MTLLWSGTNLTWTGYYLAPVPFQQIASWMGHRQFLTDLGWAVVPIYVGQQSGGIFSSAQGQKDGTDAVNLATSQGFGPGVIYMDIEGSGWNGNIQSYYQAWKDQLESSSNYSAGFYCSPFIAGILATSGFFSTMWAFKNPKGETFQNPLPTPDPSGSGANAAMWQHRRECQIQANDDGGNYIPVTDATGKTASFDLNSGSFSDPFALISSPAAPTLIDGRWLVFIGLFTWNYVFHPATPLDGNCEWFAIYAPGVSLGTGSYEISDALRITWVNKDGSTLSMEQWNLPLDRKSQTGTLVGQGTSISAIKISGP